MSVIDVDAKSGSIIISVRRGSKILFPVANVDLLRVSDNFFVNELEPSPPEAEPEAATWAEKGVFSHTITTTAFKPASREESDEVTSATSTLPRSLNTKRKLRPKVSSLKKLEGKVKLKAINKTSLKNVKKAKNVNHNNNGPTRVLVNVSTLVSQNDPALLSHNVSIPIHQNRPTLRKAKPMQSVPRNDAIKIKRPQNKPSAGVHSQVFKALKSKNTTPAIPEANSTPSTQVNNANTVSIPSVMEDKPVDTPTSNFKGYVIPRKPKAPSPEPEREPSLPEDDDAPYVSTVLQPDVKGMRSPSPPVISFEGEDGYSPLRFMVDDGSNGADIDIAALLSSPNSPDNISEASSVHESPHSSPKSRSPSAEEADPPECNESQTRTEALPEDADVLDLFSYDLGEFDF